MENGSCGYCGYKEENTSNAATIAPPSGQPVVQPQVIINNQTVSNPVVVPGVSSKNKMVALLLCIFLGGVGAHRFYVGKIGSGILYLLTGGLFGIGWVIDIILIAAGSFKDQFDLPLRQ
ncbi:TM2 domain-containing protein [Intestinimonas butyriciproducens]|nr:TM2 domain-containing protein [Intestinimonas butyriciproducens]